MIRLLISDKQLPVLIWAVNRKWKKTEMVERHHKCIPSDTKLGKKDGLKTLAIMKYLLTAYSLPL